MKLIAAVGLVLALSFGVGGCRRHVHRVVVFDKGHHHSDHCGHYHHDGNWYVVTGHRHGPRCGHAFRGGRWVLVVKR